MIFDKVRQVLAHHMEIDAESITLDTDIVEELGADSLDVVEIVMALEEEFGLIIPDESASKLFTVSQVVDYIESHV